MADLLLFVYLIIMGFPPPLHVLYHPFFLDGVFLCALSYVFISARWVLLTAMTTTLRPLRYN